MLKASCKEHLMLYLSNWFDLPVYSVRVQTESLEGQYDIPVFVTNEKGRFGYQKLNIHIQNHSIAPRSKMGERTYNSLFPSLNLCF